MTELNNAYVEALVEENRDRIHASIEIGEAAIAGGEPLVTLEEALAEADAQDVIFPEN